MSKTLDEIAQELKNNSKKVQLIYAFNGTGKTRLSKKFQHLVSPKDSDVDNYGFHNKKILYYSAFTEDLFYWNNDLTEDSSRVLHIQPNAFTKWIFEEQGQERNIVKSFQRYTNDKLTPNFDENYSQITFSFEKGNEILEDNIKISKGEESCLIWSIFYSIFEQVISTLNVVEVDERETPNFNDLEYIFIDDPVSSLDENHLIELAVDIAYLIKCSKSELKFVITTHNPLFYNILHNELNSDNKSLGYKKKEFERYRLEKLEDGSHRLAIQGNDSPFAYHLFLKNEIENAIKTGQVKKYHFNFLRNLLEKTSIFLGYSTWGELLPKDSSSGSSPNPYLSRIINLSSHSKFSGEEIPELTDNDRRVLQYLMQEINNTYHFNQSEN